MTYFGIRFKFWLTQIVIFTFAMIQAFIFTTYFENTETLVIFIARFAMIVVAITSKKKNSFGHFNNIFSIRTIGFA